MSFDLTIYPGKQFPISVTWGQIRSEYKRLIRKLDFNHAEFGTFEFLYLANGPRELITNFESIPIIYPGRISFEVSKAKDDDEWYRNYLKVKYFNNRILEFKESGNWIFWDFRMGDQLDVDLYLRCISDIDSPKVSKKQVDKFFKAFDKYRFVFSLTTDLERNTIDPIFILTIIFCNLVDGLIYVSHSRHLDYIPEGYYFSQDIADLIGLDME